MVTLIGNVLGNISIFVLLLNCLQVSLVLMMINVTVPILYYQVLKIFSIFVLPTIPDWELDGSFTETQYFFYATAHMKPYIEKLPFRIRRVGITSSFILNVHFLVFMIFILSLIICVFKLF
jgi:hypothetical protein